ncbi:hypothetical protein GCM10022252_42900 [Streptosporangium oxazolinicum]|uniref:Uncharacterized protein n=1 Tax=Streptosporangium oxazolinicum TaxID=909287 RepID=A0ABP8B241_9ACTN
MPTRSPLGKEVRTLDMKQEYASRRMTMQNKVTRVTTLTAPREVIEYRPGTPWTGTAADPPGHPPGAPGCRVRRGRRAAGSRGAGTR